jgi:hypothetical protein
MSDADCFGPAVVAKPSTRCLDCRAPLSIEAIARREDLCGPCSDDDLMIRDQWDDESNSEGPSAT